jgi:hypothetical protein
VATPPRPVIWRALFITFGQTDLAFERPDGSPARIRASIEPDMHELVVDLARRFARDVHEWSRGEVAIELDIVEAATTLSRLARYGKSEFWVSPECVREEIERHAPAGRYDSIFVVFSPHDAGGEWLPLGGGGMAIGPSGAANGAGFASVATWPSVAAWLRERCPQEIFVHEWLHQVIDFHGRAGRLQLDLHNVDRYGYRPVEGSWTDWYKAILSGSLDAARGSAGITPEIWRSATPTMATADTARSSRPLAGLLYKFARRRH